MQLTMEQRIFIAKLYYEAKRYNQLQANFRTFFHNVYQKIKPQFDKIIKKHDQERSGRRITTRTQENIKPVQ